MRRCRTPSPLTHQGHVILATLQQTHRLWCVETITPQTRAAGQDRTRAGRPGRPRPGAHAQQVWDEVVRLRTRGGLLTQRVVILPASVTEQQRRHLLDVELEAALWSRLPHPEKTPSLLPHAPAAQSIARAPGVRVRAASRAVGR